jgi:hypothetical protein
MDQRIALFVLALIVTLWIGYIVWTRDRASSSNRWFTLFALLCGAWLFSNQLPLLFYENAPLTLFLIRSHMVVSVWQIFAFYGFAASFPSRKKKIASDKLLLLGIVGLVLSGLMLSQLGFRNVAFIDGNVVPQAGLGLIGFAAYAIFCIGIGIYILAKGYVRSRDLERKQFGIVLLGAATTLLSIFLFNFLLVVIAKNSTLVSYSGLFILPFLGLLSYTIIRFGTLNATFTFTRSMVVWFLTTILALSILLLWPR